MLLFEYVDDLLFYIILNYLMENHLTMSPVSSSVPQGTVLGPLMFLIYINEDISSHLRLYADDCLLYHAIKSEQNPILLQRDLDTLS